VRLFPGRIKMEKAYTSCFFRGFKIKVLKGFNDEEFLDYCRNGVSGEKNGFVRVKSSRHTRVSHFQYKGETFFCKLYLGRNSLEMIKSIFRGSRAERALAGHLHLQQNRLGAPQVVLVGKKGGVNFMVSRAIENGKGWREHYKTEWNRVLPKEDLRNKRVSIRRLGQTVGHMHFRGISHGDLQWGNIVAVFSGPTLSSFVFLDNERTVKYRSLPVMKRVKNLVQINMITYPSVTNTDRMRFFKSYLSANPGLLFDKKALAFDVLKLTEKRLRKRKIKRSKG
jgi:hypothetical protein